MNPRLAVWIVNGLLAGLAALSLFPLLWMVSVSFMPAGASSTIPTPILPPAVTLDNYRTLFGNVGMGRYLFNSFAIAVFATLISVSFNVMAGYAFAKLRFRGRDAIFKLLLGALVIPGQVAPRRPAGSTSASAASPMRGAPAHRPTTARSRTRSMR